MHVLIVNGPNLNMLGIREPQVYGTMSLAELDRHCIAWGRELGISVTTMQSNAEHVMLDTIHGAKDTYDAIIVNAGAFSHTSIALRDAILSVDIPTYEVHMSNVYAREDFRRHSVLSDIVVAVICGCGMYGYKYALNHIIDTKQILGKDKGA